METTHRQNKYKRYNVNISEIEIKKMSKKWKQEYLKVKIIKTTKTEIEDRNIEKNKAKYLLKGQINGNQEKEHNT